MTCGLSSDGSVKTVRKKHAVGLSSGDNRITKKQASRPAQSGLGSGFGAAASRLATRDPLFRELSDKSEGLV